jgi:hypothetical protein
MPAPEKLGPPVRIGDSVYGTQRTATGPYFRDYAQTLTGGGGERYVEYQPGSDVHVTNAAAQSGAQSNGSSSGLGWGVWLAIGIACYFALNEKGGRR